MYAADDFRFRQNITGGMASVPVTQPEEALRFVERNPVRNPVAEAFHDGFGISGKPVSDVRIQPAAAQRKFLRQIPVVKRDPRRNSGFEQFVRQPGIEIQSFRIHCTGPVRQNSGPGSRKPVSVYAHLFHERYVFFIAVVMVACGAARVAAGNLPGGFREYVPHGRFPSVFVPCAFNLIGSGCGSPCEMFRKCHNYLCCKSIRAAGKSKAFFVIN